MSVGEQRRGNPDSAAYAHPVFGELASAELRFLGGRGFTVIALEPRLVAWESDAVRIQVGYDHHNEVCMSFVRSGEDVEFSLADIVRTLNVAGARQLVPIQVTSPDHLKPALERLAGFLQEFAAPVLTGDPAFFRRMAEDRARSGERYTAWAKGEAEYPTDSWLP